MFALNKIALVVMLLHCILIQFSANAFSVRPVTSRIMKSSRSLESATLKYRMGSVASSKVPQQSSSSDENAIFRQENLPLIGITIGIIAFSFQLSVLFPWHLELHRDFTILEVIRTILSCQECHGWHRIILQCTLSMMSPFSEYNSVLKIYPWNVNPSSDLK